MAASPYTNLYFSTDALVKKFKPSLSNTFDVYISKSFGLASNSDINFLAYEAVLPGTSYELGQVYGDRQGRTEQYPTKRVYPPVDVSFYIDKDYKVLKFFEEWMNAISLNYGSTSNSYVKHNYASNYECDVIITKFERDFRAQNQRLVKDGVYGPPKSSVRYTLRNAFPSNLIAIPVSYEGANVLRTTVTFNYDVYNFNDDGFPSEDGSANGTTSGPGGDASNAPTATTTNSSQSSSTNVKSTVAELQAMQEASRLRQAGYSPGLGQSGKYGPGF